MRSLKSSIIENRLPFVDGAVAISRYNVSVVCNHTVYGRGIWSK